MYRIMVNKAKKGSQDALYQYLTTTVDGVISPVEIEDKKTLDKKVEHMLSEEGYSKSDFLVVQVVDYTIDAKDYTQCTNC